MVQRFTSRAFYFWKAKVEFVSRQQGFPTKPKVKFLTFSGHGRNWTVLYFFRKSELLTVKNLELNILLGPHEIYARYEQSTAGGVNFTTNYYTSDSL